MSTDNHLEISMNCHQDSREKLLSLSGLANLEYLKVVRMWLGPRPFQNLHKLLKLQLMSCKTSDFEFSSLNRQDNLQVLTIFNIPDLTELDLGTLVNLKWLRLCMIAELNVSMSIGPSLVVLALCLCALTDEKADAFFSNRTLPNLKVLDLSSNYLTRLKSDWFTGLANIERLFLAENNIRSLSNEPLLELVHLKVLNLGYNPINEITFKGLKSLLYLDLESSEITTIKRDSLEGLSSLTELCLANTRLNQIDTEAFANTPGLVRLDLSHNNIKIDKGLFSRLVNLKQINLTRVQPKPDRDTLNRLDYLGIEVNI